MVYQLKRKQQLNIDLNQAWKFFSNPINLNEITPKDMNFKICWEVPHSIHSGQMILYKISPFFNFEINWLTEITHYQDKKFFVDNQVKGPYKLWHHQHRFTENDQGVLMVDIITYEVSLGIIGEIFRQIYIRKKIESIFDFRLDFLEKKFNTHA